MYSHHSKDGSGVASVPKEHTQNAVLLEMDGWKLLRARWPEDVGVDSYPVHLSCQAKNGCSGGVTRNRDGGFQGNCRDCKEPVPDAIQGAWILHNWDAATK